jgi:hypothetical protein
MIVAGDNVRRAAKARLSGKIHALEPRHDTAQQ